MVVYSKYNHGTSWSRLFQIWKDGAVIPQPYEGGDSSLPVGTRGIFFFKLPRILTLADVWVFPPADFSPDWRGQIPTWDGGVEEEFVYFSSIPLSGCRLVRTSTLPDLEELREEIETDLHLEGKDSSVVWTDEFEEEMVKFLDWAEKTVQKEKFLFELEGEGYI